MLQNFLLRQTISLISPVRIHFSGITQFSSVNPFETVELIFLCELFLDGRLPFGSVASVAAPFRVAYLDIRWPGEPVWRVPPIFFGPLWGATSHGWERLDAPLV
jgi:hypothetical protein